MSNVDAVRRTSFIGWISAVISRPRGISSRIYLAFLLTAVIPTSIAGLVGFFYSFDVLKREMLLHLAQEATIRAEARTNFFRQVSSELSHLASSPTLRELAGIEGSKTQVDLAGTRERITREFSAFAHAYPYIYQIRYLDADGREVVRVDRRDRGIYDVPESELQDKSASYYVRDALAMAPGEIYVSPLDANLEHGKAEYPEKPVIRLGTLISDGLGVRRGLLIVNLHAEIILDQLQDMANSRSGTAFLFNRSDFYLSRSVGGPSGGGSHTRSIDDLASFPRSLLSRILEGHRGAEVIGDWIVAYAPIMVRASIPVSQNKPLEWAIMLAYPRDKLFAAIFNLTLLYAVLAIALATTATGGFLLSRHLLRPLLSLRDETEEIAQGNFSSRVEIRGEDEIAELGKRFNAMAVRLEDYYASLQNQKQHLESEVRARTKALDRERRNLAAVIQNTADGILALSQDGTVELANAAAIALLTLSGEHVVGRHVSRFWAGWDDYVAEAAVIPPVPKSLTTRVRERILALDIAPVSGDSGHRGYIIVLRDISEERRLQDERRELDRQLFQMEKMTTLGELAMGLTHEIGNPLAGMKTVVQSLRSEALDPATTSRYLARIEGEVDRLSSFLRTFDGFAAPQQLRRQAIRLDDVLENVLLWTRKEARSQGIAIEFKRGAPSVPMLWADPHQLMQVLLNLVINAIHAMPNGGRIIVGMCRLVHPDHRDGHAPQVRFRIEDTGQGIEADVLARIFDPFFTTRANGSGLGLAVVKKIVEQHGADILVESEPGKGTRFTLVWPAAESQADETPRVFAHA